MIPIKTAGPSITEFEKNTVSDMMENGWDNYEFVEKFEKEFSAWHDRNHCLMTPCCTHAIHLILLSLGIEEGDEVIVPECTWTATAAPVTYLKAKPVFADIDSSNWCICPNSVRSKISEKTKAIIFVDLYGNMPKMEQLENISKEFNIPLIEDAAEALGSQYNGVRAGKFGVASVHSFHRTKTITSGEGGAVLIDNKELFERAKFLRDHGRSSEIPYFTLEATPKYMPSNLQASVVWAQFQRVEELVNRKRYFLHRYKDKLSDLPDIQFNEETDSVFNGVWATSIIVGESYGIQKIEMQESLKNLNIPVRPFFYPLSSLPAYSMYHGSESLNPVSYDISSRGITLPCHYELTDKQIDCISEGIKKVLNENA